MSTTTARIAELERRLAAVEERLAAIEPLVELCPSVKSKRDWDRQLQWKRDARAVAQIEDDAERAKAFAALDERRRGNVLSELPTAGVTIERFVRGFPAPLREAALSNLNARHRCRVHCNLAPLQNLGGPVVKITAPGQMTQTSQPLMTRKKALHPQQRRALQAVGLRPGQGLDDVGGSLVYAGFAILPGASLIERKAKFEKRLEVDEELREWVAEGGLKVEELPEDEARKWYFDKLQDRHSTPGVTIPLPQLDGIEPEHGMCRRLWGDLLP